MQVKMHADAKAQRKWQPQAKKPNLIQWLLVISFGVFIGNVATIGVERAISYWEIYQIAKSIESETEKMKLRMDAQGKINREQVRIRDIENQKRQAGLRQAIETCEFWQEQLAKSKLPEHKMHRDNACEMVGHFR